MVTAHGVDGALKIRSLSGETRHLRRLRQLTLVNGGTTQRFKVESARTAGSLLIAKLAGLDSREDAKGYAGWEVRVDRGNAARLGKGEYYLADLCRCRIVKDGRPAGKVKSVLEGSGRSFLEVERTNGENVLIPFEEPFVGRVDVSENSIELAADWPT